MEKSRPLIVIVGNCCSGKTTLANNLIAKGYRAKAILQEHAISKKMWNRAEPDILIHLSCNLESARNRRDFSWGQEKLDKQRELLSDALEHCDISIVTDGLSIEEVAQKAIEYLEKRILNE
jgi:tRNA uridine 5-carbamoylmethylation protein Kti12